MLKPTKRRNGGNAVDTAVPNGEINTVCLGVPPLIAAEWWGLSGNNGGFRGGLISCSGARDIRAAISHTGPTYTTIPEIYISGYNLQRLRRWINGGKTVRSANGDFDKLSHHSANAININA